jgi:hypothetical protein
MSHDLGRVGGCELAHLDFPWRVHRGIHKDGDAGVRNRVSEFGGQERTGQRVDAGQGKRIDRIGHFGPDAVIPAQRVTVTDDEKAGW